MSIIGDSGKGFGGVFSGIKGFIGDIMGNTNDAESVLGSDEYLEGSVMQEMQVEAEPVKAVETEAPVAEVKAVAEEAPVSAFEENNRHLEQAPVAEVKAAPEKSENTSYSFIKPTEFFNSVGISRKQNKGGNEMATAKASAPTSYTAPKTTERVGSAGVGFNYNQANNDMNSSANRTFTSQKTASSSGAIVQFFEPKDTKQADDICTVLKAGHIVVVNLCNIREESDKIRIIDFVAGCCKGIDAKAHTIAPKSIFIAAPRGVELRKPVVEYAEQTNEGTPASAPFFGGINFSASSNNERNLNAFDPRI